MDGVLVISGERVVMVLWLGMWSRHIYRIGRCDLSGRIRYILGELQYIVLSLDYYLQFTNGIRDRKSVV